VSANSAEPRAYRSAMRDDQARLTRRAVVSAAAELFVERGYAATTIDAVAERAGVSRRTVFTAVGGKAALLKLAWDWSLAGDDEPVPIAERAEARRIQEQTDLLVVLRMQARHIREVAARVAALDRVLAVAADGDPEAAALRQSIQEQRLTGATRFVRWLRDRGWLRRGTSVRQGAELCWVLIDPNAYRWLVTERGWTPRQFDRYLVETLSALLLDRSAIMIP
jgi:AcrR family transcriptional regulator